MKEIIFFFIANAVYIYGLHHLFDHELTNAGRYDAKQSMLFGRIAFVLDKILGLPYTKPLYACMPCMASIHGLYFYLLSPLSLPVLGVIVYLIALSGVMKLMTKI